MEVASRARTVAHTGIERSKLTSQTHGIESRFVRVFEDLAAINLRFLKLSIAQSSGSARGSPFFSDTVAQSLSDMKPEALALAAACRYSLFDLDFSDLHGWQRRIDGESASEPCGGSGASVFATAALFFAWHLVAISPTNAFGYPRLVLGLDPLLAARLADLSPSRVAELGAGAGDLLRPRWVDHVRFWPELIRSAQRQNAGELLSARLLGQQLLAAKSLVTRSAT